MEECEDDDDCMSRKKCMKLIHSNISHVEIYHENKL